MSNLKTTYLGLTLKSPVVVSSSRLTSDIGNLVSAEDHGAGAVVLKSLFEEQIMYYINKYRHSDIYPEAGDYISSYTRSHSVDEYISYLKSARKTLSIPVIASINCFSRGSWIDFSRRIQDAGADALELNVFFMPSDSSISSKDAEKEYMGLIEELLQKVTIPVSVKLGIRFTNILNIISSFYARGVKGVVMFNRFYEPDIDINKMEIVPAQIFSNPDEKRYVLRWIAMASAMGLKLDISASTGVHDGEDVVKYILAGANTVQVCSALYRNGIPFISVINKEIEDWMKHKNFTSVDEFRGKLNWKNTGKPVLFERTQFMKYFSSFD
jgi:dihydroorotate dehydrogenase (fumarate)